MSPVDRWRQSIGFVLGPALAGLVLAAPMAWLSPEAHRLAAIVSLVVTFWLTEAIPIPVTALLGAMLTVVFGVAPAREVLTAFGDPVIFLFIGSFILARAMQVHGFDRRIAYTLLAHPWVGGSTYRTLWALGAVAWLLSMWISNTACVAMLFPVALALARTTGELLNVPAGDAEAPPLRYTTGLLLMLAYAGSVGGMATPVGTPPNLIGIALIDEGLGVRIGFVEWMLVGVPVALAQLLAIYGVILLLFRPEVRAVPDQLVRMREARRALGAMTAGERNSLIAFATAVTLWVGPGLLGIALGADHPLPMLLKARLPEGIVAMFAATLLFVLPLSWRKRTFTLRWDQAVRIDWGTVLLFGGGIALGRLMFNTGLAQAVGQGLVEAIGVQGTVGLSGLAAAVASIISETSSNTASANMVVPVMLSAAHGVGLAGLRVAIAATLGASMGFMLPVSTPPNAIVYGSRAVRLTDMVRAGLLLDVSGFFMVWAAAVWLVPIALRL